LWAATAGRSAHCATLIDSDFGSYVVSIWVDELDLIPKLVLGIVRWCNAFYVKLIVLNMKVLELDVLPRR
jgi:hypothetical protein